MPSVCITAPARLHLGFLDPSGCLGRRFGSLGLALEKPYYQVRIETAKRFSAHGPDAARADAARAERYARQLHEQLGWPEGLKITLEHTIPAHAGLGSGTQLALAVSLGIARLFDLSAKSAQIATILGRGARSGIGIGAFEQGGLILDGGCKPQQTTPPPIISRLAFPEHWRVLLIFDRSREGFSGGAERRAFSELPEFSPALASQLCQTVLMRALPAAQEADFGEFGAAISALQETIGDYFAPAQGGRYTSPAVAELLGQLVQYGHKGLGQSSWGPTGFVFCPSILEAERLMNKLIKNRPASSPLRFTIGQPRNQGGLIDTHSDPLPHHHLQSTAGYA